MGFSMAVLGKKLRAARENSRITQEDAGKALGITRVAVSNIESGNRSVSTLELAQFADLYRCPIADFFTEEKHAEADLLQALYRAEPDISTDPVAKNGIERCIQICREGLSLKLLLDRGIPFPSSVYEFPAPRNTYEAVVQGNNAGVEERKRLDLGISPVYDVPELISAQGVWASVAGLPKKVSGLFIRHECLGMAILVNGEHDSRRKRFSFAHEYAHALMDRQRSITVSKDGNKDDLIEVRANAFAATFLLPPDGVRSFLASIGKGSPSRFEERVPDPTDQGSLEENIARHRAKPGSQDLTCCDTAQLADHFGVSYRATAYRLLNLGVVNNDECRALIGNENLGKTYLRSLGRTEDPGDKDRSNREPELVRQVADLALEAFRLEEISRGRAQEIATILGINAEEFLIIAESTRRR